MFQQQICLCSSTILLSIFFFTVLLLVPVAFSQKIIMGSKLSVTESNSWISSNGDFSIGFYDHSAQPNQFSVAIRFNSKSIPREQQTVVWVAGADVTVGNNSYFELTFNGELVLFDSSTRLRAWTSETSNLSVSSALLGDDGNLVLLNEKGDTVWQSFDTPSDTLIPGQSLSIYKTLRAAGKNSVSSFYSLYMNISGQLQLRWESSVVFWTSKNPAQTNLTAKLTSTGAFQLMDRKSVTVWSVFGEDHNEHVKFRFLRLDVDGNLRLYSWIESSKSWRPVWQAMENQCKVFGTCGQYGVCHFNSTGSPTCGCPFNTKSEHVQKCLTPYQQDCTASSMLTFEHSYFYGIYPPNDSVAYASLQQCKNLCMKDRTCTAVTYTNDGTGQCRMKKTQYISGYLDPALNSVSFVKKCSNPFAADFNIVKPSESQLPESQSQSRRTDTNHTCIPCLAGASAATFVVFLSIQLAIGLLVHRRRRILIKNKATSAYATQNSKGLVTFSFTEIQDLTGNFKHQIGPQLYSGVNQNHQPVLVKCLEELALEERKFRSTASKIGNIQHRNLAKLEGYCCESSHRYLVFENSKRGSVQKYIDDDELSLRLTWGRSVNICLSVAKAIFYMHTGCREFISHGNLNLENVLLDKNFDAKVTGYGFGKISYTGGGLAEKDIKDFGEMVLVLITRRRQYSDSVCEWAYTEWKDGNAEGVVDKRMKDDVDLESLERVLRIGFWCVQNDERMRPSMGEVVKVLDGTMCVDPPPPPFARRIGDTESA